MFETVDSCLQAWWHMRPDPLGRRDANVARFSTTIATITVTVVSTAIRLMYVWSPLVNLEYLYHEHSLVARLISTGEYI